MLTIDIQAIPNQSFTIALENVNYEIAIRETGGVMSVDVTRANVRVVSGARVVAGQLVLNYSDLEDGYGNFMFLTSEGDLPYYDQFGVSQDFVYATAAELATVRNDGG